MLNKFHVTNIHVMLYGFFNIITIITVVVASAAAAVSIPVQIIAYDAPPI